MIINSHNIEFGYELISVIPYACYMNSIGQLDKTISGNDTECLYYFSPNHEINPEKRSYFNIKKVDTPNRHIHTSELNLNKFLAPDYKGHYANDRFKFSKETVIICNRHNTEWSTKPINYFNLHCLSELFDLLQDKYQVIYINIEGRPELYDNAPPEPLGDFDLLKSYPKVINIHDLHKKNKDLSFNTLQLMVFANCHKFITMNGGHAILAAYFGGENFIMSKPGEPCASEIKPQFNSFYRWYHVFGGQRCVHVPDEVTLIERVRDSWIDCNPIVNVLVRTSSRPRFFDKCIKSILMQTYKNINIFVSIDQKNNDYTVKYPVYPVFVTKQSNFMAPVNSPEYGKTLPYNLYLNDLQERVKEGLIFYMDDDDMYSSSHAIEDIVKEHKKGNDLVLWRVKIGDRIIPNDDNYGHPPSLFQISGIGFSFHSKYKSLAVWEPYKRGDCRVCKKLYNEIKKKVHINEIYSEAQEGPHFGSPIDAKVYVNDNQMKEPKVKIKIISNRIGKKTFHALIVGSIKEVPESTAKGMIINGVAKLYDELQENDLISVQEPEIMPEKGKYKPEMTKKTVRKPAKKTKK